MVALHTYCGTPLNSSVHPTDERGDDRKVYSLRIRTQENQQLQTRAQQQPNAKTRMITQPTYEPSPTHEINIQNELEPSNAFGFKQAQWVSIFSFSISCQRRDIQRPTRVP